MGRIITEQEVEEEGMKVDVVEERGIGGIAILPFYGPKPLGMRPMSFRTLSNCASQIPIPRRARKLRQ